MTTTVTPEYVCNVCGWEFTLLLPKCTNCDTADSVEAFGLRPLSTVAITHVSRVATGIEGLDRVMGGGLVPGSVNLLGGQPGLGKSTLLTQVGVQVAQAGTTVAYVSAEESLSQMILRASRIAAVVPERLLAMDNTDLKVILNQFDRHKPGLVIVDSIQAIMHPAVRAATGGTSQVRACTERLLAWAKRHRTPVFVVGHLTKGGKMAGPGTLAHMVDAVLYLEPSRRFIHQRRLFATKNRFGSTTEEAMFAMMPSGLREWKPTGIDPTE